MANFYTIDEYVRFFSKEWKIVTQLRSRLPFVESCSTPWNNQFGIFLKIERCFWYACGGSILSLKFPFYCADFRSVGCCLGKMTAQIFFRLDSWPSWEYFLCIYSRIWDINAFLSRFMTIHARNKFNLVGGALGEEEFQAAVNKRRIVSVAGVDLRLWEELGKYKFKSGKNKFLLEQY